MAVEKKSLMSSKSTAKKSVVARSSGTKITATPTKASPVTRKLDKTSPFRIAN